MGGEKPVFTAHTQQSHVNASGLITVVGVRVVLIAEFVLRLFFGARLRQRDGRHVVEAGGRSRLLHAVNGLGLRTTALLVERVASATVGLVAVGEDGRGGAVDARLHLLVERHALRALLFGS